MRSPTQANPIDPKVVAAIDLRTRALRERASGTSDNLQAINYYFTSRTPWVRLISSVDTAAEGSQLAEDNKLGMLYNDNDSRLPSGTEISNTFGVRPKAGITSLQVTSLGRFGALRDLTISFTCFSKEQLEKYEQLFMRPGASMLVEWGHSLYLEEDGDTIQVKQMGPGYTGMFDGSTKTILGVYQQIKEKRETYNYEYDAAFGLVKNFSWSFDGNGPSYTCQVVVGSCGEVVGSLEAQKPLPDYLAFKYSEQNAYGLEPRPEPQENTQQPSGSLPPSVPPSTASPQDATATNIPNQARATGELVQTRVKEIKNKFVPFLDARTEVEISSMLKTFLYQDLICVYHLKKIEELQANLSRDLSLGLFDRSDEPSEAAVFKNKAYISKQTIEPKPVDQDSEQNTWLINELGYKGELLTIFFTETEDESVDDLSQEDLKKLNEGKELESYKRYRAMSYIRYADLLSFLNNVLIFGSRKGLIEFDTSPVGTMYYNGILHSLDPRSCLLPSDVAILGKLESVTFHKGTGYDKILDIALNISKLYEIAENTKGSVKDYLEAVNSEIQTVTGGIIDLDITYSEETGKYIILDRKRYRTASIPLLSILGTDTMATDVKLATSISNDITSAVAISLGQSKSASDASKSLLNFHRGITDRNLPIRNSYPPVIEKKAEKKGGDANNQQQNAALIPTTLKLLYEERLFSDLLTDNLVRLYATYMVENADPKSLGGVILPYKLDLTLDGFAGLLVMDSFQIKTDILPSTYVNADKVGNLITGVDSTVDRSGWKTSVKSQYYNLQSYGKDLRIKNYTPKPTPKKSAKAIGGSSYGNIQHRGEVVYSLDPNHPKYGDYNLLKWTQANFNESIQPQIIGLFKSLVSIVPADIANIGSQELYGYSFYITSTFRTIEKQAQLYKDYKEGRSKIIAAPPGNSMHNWGGAFDFNILNSKTGVFLFTGDTPETEWAKLGMKPIAAKYGFRYGIKNDPIHIGYAISGKTVKAAYDTGTVSTTLGSPITDASGSLVEPYKQGGGEFAVDLTKFTSNPGLVLAANQPTYIINQLPVDFEQGN